MDPLSVDLDNFETNQTSKVFEGTRDSHARTDIGSEHLVGVKMASDCANELGTRR